MSILNIIQLEKAEIFNKETKLRSPSEDVSDFGPEFQLQLEDVIDTFYSWKIAVGLSAPQVGIMKRFGVVNLDKKDKAKTLVLINPVILSESGKKDIKKESCLSVPYFRGPVERRDKIFFSNQDKFGKTYKSQADGFYARVIMHEIDHMDGILYVDRLQENRELEEFNSIAWE